MSHRLTQLQRFLRSLTVPELVDLERMLDEVGPIAAADIDDIADAEKQAKVIRLAEWVAPREHRVTCPPDDDGDDSPPTAA